MLDVYALGQVLKYMLTGAEPLADGSFTLKVIPEDAGWCACLVPAKPPMERASRETSELPADAADLLGRMLAERARERIDIQQAIDHPWMQAGDTLPPAVLDVV